MKPTVWNAKAGNFTANTKCKIQFRLPEFDDSKVIEHTVHVDTTPLKTQPKYDMILGTDLSEELGITLDFKERVMTWEGATAPMKSRELASDFEGLNDLLEEIEDSFYAKELMDRMDGILDADYHKANINDVTAEARHPTPEEQKQLNFLLKRYEDLFDGQLGKWNGPPINFELKEGAKPCHAKPFPIPKSLEEATKKECERLCKIGVLRKINRSEWAAPTFIRPKKNKRVRFLSDFRELNKRIK